jgi:hypothetical protein
MIRVIVLAAMIAAAMLFVGCYDYSTESTSVQCEGEIGDCVICTNGDCSAHVSIVIPEPHPRDACDKSGVTNMLEGSCWWEQCVKGEKSIFPKIAGVPCVYAPKTGNSPWAEGTCDGEGVCASGTP